MRAVWLALVVVSSIGSLSGFANPPRKPLNAPPGRVKPVAPTKVAVPPQPKPVDPGPVWCVAFSPDGARIAVGGYQRVRVYDTATGARVGDWPVPGDAVRAIAYSPDGKMLAVGTGVPAQGGVAFLIEASTGRMMRAIKSHGDTVEAVAFFENLVLTAADDERVVLTDATSGRMVGKLTEHNGRCLAIAVPSRFNDDQGGEIFFTAGADHMIKVWDARARRVVVNLDQCGSPVTCLAARPPHAGNVVAGSGDGKIRYFGIYRDKNGKPDEQGVWPRGGYQGAIHDGHDGGVYALAVAPNDAFVVSSGADRRLVMWGMGGGRRREWRDTDSDIWGIAVSPDSKRIAAAAMDGKVRLYDAETMKRLLTLDARGVYTPPPVTHVAGVSGKPGTGTGLRGSYYNNPEGSGKPVLVRVDPTVDFDWNDVPPENGVNREGLFVRWEGFVEAPQTGTYTFITRTDDGARLWVNGYQIVDSWRDRSVIDDLSEPVSLKAGQRVPIRMEYYQGGGGAEAHLYWQITGREREPIPTKHLYPPANARLRNGAPEPKPSRTPPPSIRVTKGDRQ